MIMNGIHQNQMVHQEKVLNVDKIKSLGWEPKISLREGIKSTYEWYKKSIGYEEVSNTVNLFQRFINWMDQ